MDLPNNNQKQIQDEIDFISKLNGYGSLSRAQTDNLYGINNHKTGTPAPKNKDAHGYTFFTRPLLNLHDDNLAMSRFFTPLLTSDDKSMSRAIRAMLDPRAEREEGIKSAVFDWRQPFLPILSNNLISISGWPDITVDTYTSKEGHYKESFSMVDSTSEIFNTFDVTANFRNIQGDPITLLMAIWVKYSAMVYEGTMVPYPDMIIENEIDYMTRIYRLVMDETDTYVQKIAATGAAFPMASPLGASFNYNDEEEFNFENDQISIPFRCIGATYMDPILTKEFNEYVSMMNGSMKDGRRESMMKKISPREYYAPYGYIGKSLSKALSHRMYPRIEPTTMELEWWAYIFDYNNAITAMETSSLIKPNDPGDNSNTVAGTTTSNFDAIAGVKV